MRKTWPLWNCIPEETQILLRLYQDRCYGVRLDLTFKDKEEPAIESTEEIETLMETPPTRSRGLY